MRDAVGFVAGAAACMIVAFGVVFAMALPARAAWRLAGWMTGACS